MINTIADCIVFISVYSFIITMIMWILYEIVLWRFEPIDNFKFDFNNEDKNQII